MPGDAALAGLPKQVYTGCWNARILPPHYVLGAANAGQVAVVSGLYVDPDGSKDGVDVAEYGTGYIVFEAGSDTVTIRSKAPTTAQDRAGIRVFHQGAGALVEYALIADANIGIDTHAPLIARHTDIHACATACVSACGTIVTMDSSAAGSTNGTRIDTDHSQVTITYTTLHHYSDYGLRMADAGKPILRDVRLGDAPHSRHLG